MGDTHETPSDTPIVPPETPKPEQEGAGGQKKDPDSLGEDLRREPSRAAKEKSDRELGSINIEFSSGIVNSDRIAVAGQVFNQQLHFTSGGMESVRLSADHFKSRTTEDLEICEEELIFEDRQIEELRSSFEETRILILAGEPETGKGSLGLILGARMSRTLKGKGLHTCQGLGASVKVDLDKLAEDEAFSHYVVMFEDALAGESSDLKTFLRTIDPIRLAALKKRLHENSAALLLTATSSSITDFARRLENLGILRTINPPEPDLLVQALHHFAARLPQNEPRNKIVATFLTEHEMDLARELKTVPRVDRFVQEHLGEVAEGKLSIRQALSRMDDLSRWLTDDLGNDLDAQASVLAIVFGSAIPPAAGVSWLAFDELRRQITELLRKELRISEDEPSSPPGLGRDFLHRARAYVAIMPSPLTDLVRFRDERYPQRLWQALLGPARNLATLMIPLLQELARGRSPVLREIATTALGRLGQIGPFDLAVPLLRSWIRQKPSGEELAGGLLQGSIGSGDETYKNLCLATIRDLVLEGSDGVAETAVRSLSLLGMPEPAVPIRELCDIAQERLLIQLDTLREVDREITEKEEEIRRGYDPRQVASALKSLHKRGDLMLIAALVPEDQIRLLGAAQYALAGVLFSQGGDPGPVLRELLAQMKAEPVKLAPLFAYFFLHRYGLIDLLDRYKWSSSDFDTDTSRFLLASRQGERDPEALRELLEKIFLALETFPGFFRFLLERRFFEILKSWSQEGCEVIGLRPTVVRLLSVLRATGNGALRSRLERFLETDPEFVVRGSRLQALARDVLAGQGLEDVPARISRPRRLPGWLKKSEDTNS